MLELKETILTNCIVHVVGNRVREEKLVQSKKEIPMDDELLSQLTQYFLKPFSGNQESFRFYHEVDLKMNEVLGLTHNLLEGEDFVSNSALIASHLFNETRNPAIKAGELFVALFEDVVYEGAICKAVGIFKAERKDVFFTIAEAAKAVEFSSHHGVNQQKLDKGCLILNDDYHEGYRVFCYEQGGADTDYWRNDFLNIAPREDKYFQTKELMTLCKEFVTERLPEEFNVTKTDQITMLNKSAQYFKENDNFQLADFSETVLENPEVSESFRQYKKEYENQVGVKLPNSFDIAASAVKKQAKVFKSILKLDKNFHVYIHGDRNLIEQGTEQDGRKYYKIYYEREL